MTMQSKTAAKMIEAAERELSPVFFRIDEIEYENTERILNSFLENRVGTRHFSPTTGYGYDDIGRDTLDKLFANALFCEDALVRSHIVSGTHAIFLALSGLLSSSETLLSITGTPYDTLQTAIGLTGEATRASLIGRGVNYREIPITEKGGLNLNSLKEELKLKPRIAYIQRSRGYAWRDSISLSAMKEAFKLIKSDSPETLIVVDNCYGEFTAVKEPTCFGADIIIGSLIKNPGGGLAPTGGYIAGKAKLIGEIAETLTVPGMGREVGSYAGSYRAFYQGLFMAPHVVAESLKTAALFAKLFEDLGFETKPRSNDERSDIVQSLRFNSREALIAFIQSVQATSPVDGYALPEPWDMPGYDDKVIMAAGTFVSGASIELSADAPIREPYTAYIQGALSYAHGKIGAKRAIAAILETQK
ncbi:MAG: methionine gamma-lyase family protein [Clostridia bacterium]